MLAYAGVLRLPRWCRQNSHVTCSKKYGGSLPACVEIFCIAWFIPEYSKVPSFTCLCGCSGVRRVLYKLLNQVRPGSYWSCDQDQLSKSFVPQPLGISNWKFSSTGARSFMGRRWLKILTDGQTTDTWVIGTHLGQTWFSCSLYSFHSEQAEQKSSALEHLCWRTPEYSVFRGGADRTVTWPVPKKMADHCLHAWKYFVSLDLFRSTPKCPVLLV